MTMIPDLDVHIIYLCTVFLTLLLSFVIDRRIEDYMSEKISYIVTLEGWDANFDKVNVCSVHTIHIPVYLHKYCSS